MWYFIAVLGIIWIGLSINWGLIGIANSIFQGLTNIANALKK